MADTLNPSEAVFGFAAWLTCREERTVMSASDDAGIIANLVEEFCKVNNLGPLSEHWPQHLIHPSGEVAVPNVGHNKIINTDASQCSCAGDQGGPCSACMEAKFNL